MSNSTRKPDPNPRPEIVAEISANHNGSLNRALDIVRAVADTGADSIKLQTYRADTITLDSSAPAFLIDPQHRLWGGRRLYDLYHEAHTPWEWHEPIFELARSLGLDAFSTPFDESAVDFLESLNVSRYKIASIEIVDIPLIQKVASTGKPLVLSTGASTLLEVEEALAAIRATGIVDITLLVCSSSYPAVASDSHLARMDTLSTSFGTKVGFSDHTVGNGAAIAAAILGATLIEKHVTLDKSGHGPDDAFSSTPIELATLISEVEAACAAIGEPEFRYSQSEETSRNLRPSLWIVADVQAGDVVSHENVASLRPSGGLPPAAFPTVAGKRFKEPLLKGTPLAENHLC